MKTIAVLGAGYAGLRTVKRLAHSNVNTRIVLVNKNPYHYESTQLHQVAAGTKEPADVSFDIKKSLPAGVEFILDEVVSIDEAKRVVTFKKHESLVYDYLVNALGFESETFGIKGAEENGWPLIDIDTALAAREHLEHTLASYRHSHDENDLHIAVCGAGFTSIEYLGELVYRMPELVKRYGLPADKIKIYCIEAAPKVLPMFDDKMVAWAVDYLKKRGVEFHTSTPITEVKAGSVVSNGLEFKANTIIWTTGVRGSHVIADSGYDQKRNRVVVKDDLSVEGHPEEFLIGDVSAVPDPSTGRFYPTTAQISIAQADTAAANLAALLEGRKTSKFDFKSVGTVCSLGPQAGIADIHMMGHWKLKGAIVGVVKKIVNDRSVLELAKVSNMLESN
ncbi:pyridine nucleotide-disulfide oxidoreductase [Bifidobacterium aemilianum]|uniref:Pyridine nucleotide-disulfide oxidoreductase n=1 Tax=Bifidobacterium aemilianum TaxID=2493120 RepID=A0A366K6Q8_9BIFI|nr:NAD(P)/FAD-dependent oxidoreductase [Bifidobacterium aemilianum]RBP97430.1 pyridine nucleotide-disulfide oxidoreductase [Bifidobacterium aemilianum]